MDLLRPRKRPPMTDDPKARDYWKGSELAPKLQILRRQLTSSFDDDRMRFEKTKLELDKLPYSLGGMSYALFEFIRLQGELVKTLAPKRGAFGPASVETEPLSYMVDMFLDHANRMIKAASFYVKERYSLHDVKEDKKLAGKVPDPGVRNLITEYWERYGETVTDYRDFAQHHELLASDYRIFADVEGAPAVYLAIPNNPKEAKAQRGREPSYDPPIHAVPYMREVFYESIRFVNRLSFRLLDPSKPDNVGSLGPNIRGRSWQGVRVASVSMIDAELRKLRKELAEEEGHGAA